ncbi:MAG: pyruvate kinase [bacterium]
MSISYEDRIRYWSGRKPHLTRIVATVGPASESEAMLASLVDAGVDVFRLNFSHGTHDEHQQRYDHIRRITEEKGAFVSILQDISGPKLRIGEFENGRIELHRGGAFRISTDWESGNEGGVGVVDEGWLQSVSSGDRVMLGDGMVQLRVTSRDRRGLDCEVIAGGDVTSRQGINFPDSELELGAITEKDWRDIEFGLSLGVDAIAISFVQGPDDLIAVRSFVQRSNHRPLLIAKIERPQAVRNLQGILERSDGIMVARGDLGITLPIERVPVIQKELIRRAREAGKVVITATQMLESMIHSVRPTRAEATDVANAVYDGTDAVMLSGETAVGDNPVNVVEMMARILRETEPNVQLPRLDSNDPSIDESMARAVKDLVGELKPSAIIVPHSAGTTAMRLSRQRLGVPILVGNADAALARRIQMYSGMFLFTVAEDGTFFENLKMLLNVAQQVGWVREGDRVLVSGGFPMEQRGVTNFIRAHTVGDPV